MDQKNTNSLEAIEIKNFKCFKDISLSGFGSINLILGDNNIGKTSILEALLFDENAQTFLGNIRGLYTGKNNSSNLDGINYVKPFINISTGSQSFSIKASYKGNKKSETFSVKSVDWSGLSKEQQAKFADRNRSSGFVVFKHNTVEEAISLNNYDFDNDLEPYMPFIAPRHIYASDLLEFYSHAIIPSKQKKLNLIRDMELFVPDLEDIEISTQNSSSPLLITRIKGLDSSIPLGMYGDGSIKLFRILAEIAVVAGGRLMIDEIDAGIHFSRLTTLWKAVINSAMQNNVQLFMTTHNNECLAALKDVLNMAEYKHLQDGCKCYSLRKLPDASTEAYEYEFKEFEYALKQHIELRGEASMSQGNNDPNKKRE